MRTWEMKVHFFMIILRPIRHAQVSSKFFRRLRTSGDLTLQKRLVLFLHHPHLKGWQRVHHSESSIREGWHRSQSISFHIRGVRVSIWGLMDIMIWRIMHISIILRTSLRNRRVSTMMFIWGLYPYDEYDPCEEFGPYEDLDPYEGFGPYEEFGLGFLFFTGGVMITFTWRLSRHFLGNRIFFIGGPFL